MQVLIEAELVPDMIKQQFLFMKNIWQSESCQVMVN